MNTIKMSNNSITSVLIRQSRLKYISRLSTKLFDVNSTSRLKKDKKERAKSKFICSMKAWDHVIILNEHCIAQAARAGEMKCFPTFFSSSPLQPVPYAGPAYAATETESDEDISNRSSRIPAICTQHL